MMQVTEVLRIDRLAGVAIRPGAYAGIDEVGVDSIAGPMMAAVVVLPENHDVAGLPIDSKRLGPDTIQAMAAPIEAAVFFAWIGALDAAAVDVLGVHKARELLWQTAAAMVRDVLPAIPIVVDGGEAIPGVENQHAIPRADDSHDAVSAAAILSKGRCDRAMAVLDAEFPGYGFAKHKGYRTKEHLRALQDLGPSTAHRRRNTEKAMRKGVPEEKCDLPLEELQGMLRELAPLLKAHPELDDEWSRNFLRDQWRGVMLRGQRPSERQQFFIMKAHRQVMKDARKRGITARSTGSDSA